MWVNARKAEKNQASPFRLVLAFCSPSVNNQKHAILNDPKNSFHGNFSDFLRHERASKVENRQRGKRLGSAICNVKNRIICKMQANSSKNCPFR